MPIRPENKDRYPRDWKLIVSEVLERAGNRCECEGECGLHHGRRCCEENHTSAKYARGEIVLTIAHLDHTPENVGESGNRTNLKAMCQRCHNRYDAKTRAAGRIRRRREALNCKELFDITEAK